MNNTAYEQWVAMQLEPDMDIQTGRPVAKKKWPEPEPTKGDARTWAEICKENEAYIKRYKTG